MNDDISYLYVDPEITKAFEEMDKEEEVEDFVKKLVKDYGKTIKKLSKN